MCCLFGTMALLGPRAAVLVWWLIDTDRWRAAFDNFFWAFLGFLFLPWTTLALVAVAGNGVLGFDWIILGLGLLLDVASYSSSAYGGRQRYT